MIPPFTKMQIDLDIENNNLLQKMYLSDVLLADRFKTKYSEEDEKKYIDACTFSIGAKKWIINDMRLEIDQAYLYYLEFDFIQPIPKTIQSNFMGHSLIISKLTDASRQTISLFFPPSRSSTDIFISFLREGDLNNNFSPDLFTMCRGLPPYLQEMSLTHTQNINSEPSIFNNFYLSDLHINKMNHSWERYLHYLEDHHYLDANLSKKFFSCKPTRIDKNSSELSTENLGHSAFSVFPVALSHIGDNERPLISVQSEQINYSSLALNLMFNQQSTDLSQYYVAITYFNRYTIKFDLSHNLINILPMKTHN